MRALPTLLVGTLLVSACAVEKQPEGKPFSDDFSAATIGAAWKSTGGNYRVQGGALVIDHAYNHPLWLTSPLPTDGVIELDAWSNDPAGDIKIELWGDGKSFATQASYTATSYVFIFGGWHNQISAIARMNEHGKDRRTRTDVKVVPGQKYHFRIERHGGHLDWQLDGKPFLSFDDPQPLVGPEHAYLAINDWEAELHFDNLVCDPDGHEVSAAIHFLGAAREVTGSMHLIECEAGRILVDCGMYQGRREESNQRNRHLPKEALGADAVILTHAHIDHSGSLPTLVKRGYQGSIWATAATRDLASYMLRDAARIQVGDADWLNRKNADDPRWNEITPLYDEDDATRALDRFRSVGYDTRFEPLPGVTARFLDAGHILGSAQVVLELPDRGKLRRVVLSGDLGRRGLPILRDPVMPSQADYVVMESTYGNRVHGSLAQMHDDLARVVADAVRRGGKMIIPAFAVGRTQEVVYALHQLHRQGRVPEIPIFVDSPLATNVTEVFTRHPECYDEETAAFLKDTGDPFHFSQLRYIESREESMRLNELRGPAIIISASGMCEAGRVLHHLRNNVEDEHNTILIIGFMAQHTLGRRLLERRPKVRIFGVERDLHAQVRVLDAFSAHGDRDDLHAYARGIEGVRRVFLVHGEPDQQDPFAASLRGQGLDVHVPERGVTEELA